MSIVSDECDSVKRGKKEKLLEFISKILRPQDMERTYDTDKFGLETSGVRE